MIKILPVKPNKKEKVYADFDEEQMCWCVFGESSGFCYVQPVGKDEAQLFVQQHNIDFK